MHKEDSKYIKHLEARIDRLNNENELLKIYVEFYEEQLDKYRGLLQMAVKKFEER